MDNPDEIRAQIAELCEELASHIKLLRDYGTTPHNVWLARGELNKIGEQIAELEALLSKLNKADG